MLSILNASLPFLICAGMDYIVAHLLRVLQETVEWNLPRGKLPPCVESAVIWAENKKVPLHETLVVEETIFQVMDTLMSVYGFKHMYWPGMYSALQCTCEVFIFSWFLIVIHFIR